MVKNSSRSAEGFAEPAPTPGQPLLQATAVTFSEERKGNDHKESEAAGDTDPLRSVGTRPCMLQWGPVNV